MSVVRNLGGDSRQLHHEGLPWAGVPGNMALKLCPIGTQRWFHWPGMEMSTSFCWPRRRFRIQQDIFFMKGSLMITEAATVNRPSSSGFLDSDVDGNFSPSEVLHCTWGSGYHPTEVHSSRTSPFSRTSIWMWGSEPRAMEREAGLTFSVDNLLGAL